MVDMSAGIEGKSDWASKIKECIVALQSEVATLHRHDDHLKGRIAAAEKLTAASTAEGERYMYANDTRIEALETSLRALHGLYEKQVADPDTLGNQQEGGHEDDPRDKRIRQLETDLSQARQVASRYKEDAEKWRTLRDDHAYTFACLCKELGLKRPA